MYEKQQRIKVILSSFNSAHHAHSRKKIINPHNLTFFQCNNIFTRNPTQAEQTTNNKYASSSTPNLDIS